MSYLYIYIYILITSPLLDSRDLNLHWKRKYLKLKIFLQKSRCLPCLYRWLCNTFSPKFYNGPIWSLHNTPLVVTVWSAVVNMRWEHVRHIIGATIHPLLCACLIFSCVRIMTSTRWPHLIIPCLYLHILILVTCTTASGISTCNVVLIHVRTLALIITLVE